MEAILSQRAVAIAQAQNGSRVDCVGASKGLFFGLLLLVGSLICMLLFFVLIHHDQFSWLAVYLADASHSTVMALSILAIIIGFCRYDPRPRVQKFLLDSRMKERSTSKLFSFETINFLSLGCGFHIKGKDWLFCKI